MCLLPQVTPTVFVLITEPLLHKATVSCILVSDENTSSTPMREGGLHYSLSHYLMTSNPNFITDDSVGWPASVFYFLARSTSCLVYLAEVVSRFSELTSNLFIFFVARVMIF